MSGQRPSVLTRFVREPWRFGFDAGVRVLARAARHADFADIARFRTPAGLAYPPADVIAVQPGQDAPPATGRPGGNSRLPLVTVGMMGLTGPSGVLPRFFTEVVTATLRDRSRALHEFLDMLSHRMVALFARAGRRSIASTGPLKRHCSKRSRDPTRPRTRCCR